MQTRKDQSVNIIQCYEKILWESINEELWKISIQNMNKPLFHCIVEGISSISTAYRKENFVMIDDRSKKIK